MREYSEIEKECILSILKTYTAAIVEAKKEYENGEITGKEYARKLAEQMKDAFVAIVGE